VNHSANPPSSGLPGKITWLARVDRVSVQLASTEPFGQVKSGLLTLTGHLGVFRIKQSGHDAAPSDVAGNLDPTDLQISASWDTKDPSLPQSSSPRTLDLNLAIWRYTTYHGLNRSTNPLIDVFYMPVRLMDADANEADYEAPVVTGLLLTPLGGRNGYYRRIGQFELAEQWLPRGQTVEAMTRSTGIADRRFFVEKHKRGKYTICVV
jgi:hypothetical protein